MGVESLKRKKNPKLPRQRLPLLEAAARQTTGDEVALGFGVEQAMAEASRCIQCADPRCTAACPVHTDIPGFIAALAAADFDGAGAHILATNPFPGICGRVCQYELFCEKACVLGRKLEPVAIGALERFAAAYSSKARLTAAPGPNGRRVALVGSGPASLMAAWELARKGYRVTVLEALHELGGVLAYGIPPFRLPRAVIAEEIGRLRAMGVEFRTDFIVGRTSSIDELLARGFDAVFVGAGAGLPHLMHIPGENLTGVYTANEFLTRINLMRASEFPRAATPVLVGARTIVVGGGNSAMDAARWARRFGSETTVLFRRGRAEMRARREEIEHAAEEGVRFEFLAAPVRLLGDEQGKVREMECIRMRLGAPDDSGRPAPEPIEGSEFRIAADTVVAAIGQRPNPTVQRATPQIATRHGKILVDEHGQTSMPRVFAGGDVVRGGSTVILALHDGRAAAEAIDRALAGAPVANAHAPIPAARFRIAGRRRLAPSVVSLDVEAPQIAARWKAGQFVIVRPLADSERIPLTLVGADALSGTIRLVVQEVGATTREIGRLQEGDTFADVLGPLGQAAAIERAGRVVCVGGGVGVAELLPVARALSEAGNRVTALCGARSDEHRILREELEAACEEVHWSTDDGSAGLRGTVADLMHWWRAQSGETPDLAHVIGPIPMMRACAEVTRSWGVRTLASLNPIMVDGTGMCGGCRVTVGGRVRFACVDGPEFDAHQVDFDELARRNRAYAAQERQAAGHACRVLPP
jgi:glutamate synthase (NADPH/NADH) small chain